MLQDSLQVVQWPQGWFWIDDWEIGEDPPLLTSFFCWPLKHVCPSAKAVPQDDNGWIFWVLSDLSLNRPVSLQTMQRQACWKRERKEANQGKEFANKKRDTAQCKNSTSHNHNNVSKCAQQENICHSCKSDRCDALLQSFAFHNWNNPDYIKPMGSYTNCPWDQASQDCEGACDRCKCHCSFSRKIVDWQHYFGDVRDFKHTVTYWK